ncbi:hypothetical protein ACFQ7B_00305 [Streptomyces erythrochromogenes]|uniref:hypothetical protein n=1 Tax=Streptomyces erythrochromogenes TaxID=285574 RepID=UPI0036C6674C
MSDEQQPRPDEEPRTAHYQRADASRFPTDPLGQRAAVEGMATAEGFEIPGDTEATRAHNRRALARTGRPKAEQPAPDQLRDKLLAVIEEYEEAQERHRAQEEAAYGLTAFAERYAKAQTAQERDDLAEQFGGSLTLPEAGLIRRVAKAAEQSLPDVIVDAHVDGMTAPQIARELACSSRHAYQVIKDYPWDAQWTLYRAMWLPRMDYEWVEVASGTVETTETANDLAQQILDERLDNTLAREGARVCVWRTGDGNDMYEARGTATQQSYEGEFPPIED